MKKWINYYNEREGLADIGNQDLSVEDAPDQSNIIKKAFGIAWNAGDPVRMKIIKFLKRIGRDIPQLHNLVSQLESDDDDKPIHKSKEKQMPVVTTPSSDSSPQPGTGQ